MGEASLEEELLQAIISEPVPLAEEQIKVVTAKERYIKVVAGAGTGKTETLIRRLLYLLLCKNEPPEGIVAFTFTEKAAQGMKTRIHARIHDLGLEGKIPGLSNMYIGTIHSYCLHLLRKEFGYSDFSVLDENQEVAFVLRVGRELGFEDSKFEKLFLEKGYIEKCRSFIESVNIVYNELIEDEALQRECPGFYFLFQRYEELLDRYRLLTFGRMITLAVRNLKHNREKVSCLRHLMVDEYQDINRAQQELIRLLGQEASVFVVGDPRQSIYQWRGSDERFFEEFEKYFPGAKTFYLLQNRRSVPQIVEVANYFERTLGKNYGPLSAVRKKSEGGAFLAALYMPDSEAGWVVEEIDRGVKSGKCRFRDCAILFRSVANYAQPFIEELRRLKVPYLVGGKIGLFKRKEAKAMHHFFSWLKERNRYVTYQEWKLRSDELLRRGLKLWREATNISLCEELVVPALQSWREEVLTGKYQNLTQVFYRLLVILGYLELDPDNPLHAVLMANLGRFGSMLVDYETAARLGGRKINWPGLVEGLDLYMSYAFEAYEEYSGEDVQDVDAVFVGTVHQAKGLEWPVVFVSSVVSPRFPSSRYKFPKSWLLPKHIFDAERYAGSWEEEARLFYVALTRARDVLCVTSFTHYISFSSGRELPRRPSEFFCTLRELLPVLGDLDVLPFSGVESSSNEESPKYLSAREIVSYRRCPYFYRLREKWGYPSGLVEELGYGRSLYSCLVRTLELLREGEDSARAVERAVEEKFFLPFADKKTFAFLKEKATRTLLEFVGRYLEELLKIEDTALRAEVFLEDMVVGSSADAVLRDDGKLAVLIGRTSQKTTVPEEVAFQLKLSVLALKQDGESLPRAFFANFGDSTLEEILVDEESLQNVSASLKDILEKIKNNQFSGVARVENCNRCDYWEICRFYKQKFGSSNLSREGGHQ